MIKELKYKIPVKEGNITTGIKAVSQSTGKEYPKSVDYFVIDDFPELTKAYGTKPNKLVLFFPTNNPEDFLDVNYVLYGGNQQLIRKCDGETCFHRIDNEIESAKFKAGSTTPCICKDYELAPDHKKKCHTFFWMKAFIGDPKLGKVESPMCYLFKSGSKNNAENIISELNKVRNITNGNLIGIPFGLSVEMVSGSQDAKTKFPIWKLQGIGSISQMKLWNESPTMLIPTRQELKQIEQTTEPDNLFNPDNPLNI